MTVALDPPLELTLPYPVMRQAPEPITPSLRSAPYGASLTDQVQQLELKDDWPPKLYSSVTVGNGQGLQLQMGCFGDERQVRLHGAPSDATGDLTLSFDETQLTARWNVGLVDGLPTLTPPTTNERSTTCG